MSSLNRRFQQPRGTRASRVKTPPTGRDYIIGQRKKKTRRDLDIASMQEILDDVFKRKRTHKEAAIA